MRITRLVGLGEAGAINLEKGITTMEEQDWINDKPPNRIFLQWYAEDEIFISEEEPAIDTGLIAAHPDYRTWSGDSAIGEHDVEYIRADITGDSLQLLYSMQNEIIEHRVLPDLLLLQQWIDDLSLDPEIIVNGLVIMARMLKVLGYGDE